MLESRLTQILAVFAIANVLVVAHLVRLQVVERAKWVAKGEESRTRRRFVESVRGPILFADGAVAAESETRFDLVVRPSRLRDRWPIGALASLVDKLDLGHGFWRGRGGEPPTADDLTAEGARRASVVARVIARPEIAFRTVLDARVSALLEVDECLLDGRRGTAFDAVFGRRTYRAVRRAARDVEDDALTIGAALRLDVKQRERIVARLLRESEVFESVRLSVSTGADGLLDGIYREVMAAERNAATRLVKRGIPPATELDALPRDDRGYYRKVTADHLARTRKVVRRLRYDTVYRVDAAVFAKRLAGFDLEQYLSRVYPCDLAPHLVGVTGDVPESWMPERRDDGTDDIMRARALDRRAAMARQRDILARPGLSDEDIIEIRALEDAILEKPHTYDRNVGRSGVEAAYERVLRGRRGSERVLRIPGQADPFKIHAVEPEPGRTVHLSIDSRLQRYAGALLARDRASRAGPEEGRGYGGGALVALDPRSGRVLAIVTDPTYRRDTIQTRDGLRAMLDREDRPFRNRAIECHTPGSVFKVFTAILGIEFNDLPRGRHIHCWARIRPGKKPKCSAHYTPTEVALDEALGKSCNAYFTTVGEEVVRKHGTDLVLAAFDRLGLGRRTLATNLNRRHEGRIGVPFGRTDRYVFKRRFMAQTAIGQGPVVVSPLGVAQLYSIVANGGVARAAFLTEESPNRALEPERVVEASVIDRIMPGLIATVSSGTADKPLFRTLRKDLGGMEIAGKTGSATFSKESGRPKHAWFAGFAPARDPEIVVVVFLEHRGKGGGAGAGPVAAAFLSKYFHLTGRAPRVLVDVDG